MDNFDLYWTGMEKILSQYARGLIGTDEARWAIARGGFLFWSSALLKEDVPA